MKFICPHCKQHLEGEANLAGASVECPSCGVTFVATSSSEETTPEDAQQKRTSEGELDAANDFLERVIGNILHAIWGIVRRVGHVFKWIAMRLYDVANWLFRLLVDIVKFFFSIRFLKFLILLALLAIVCAIFVGIIVAPFFLWIWFSKGTPLATMKCLMTMPLKDVASLVWRTALKWPCGVGFKDSVYPMAWIIEGVWLVLFAGWGAWKGVKSYKRGVIARWRERRRIRKAERRAQKDAKRAAKEAARQAPQQMKEEL